MLSFNFFDKSASRTWALRSGASSDSRSGPVPVTAGHPLTVDLDENLECDPDFNDGARESRLLELFEDLCWGDIGLIDELLSPDQSGNWAALDSSDGSKYPSPSHGLLVLLVVWYSLGCGHVTSSKVDVWSWGGLVASSVVDDTGV